ncbi:MAG: hypothetical protein AUI10_09780 [Actinobacteria bacterium 13_2_20CM_2_72_6]|nr:MAG: hypothetical protein AUI10_09780 [Actinobacteria bacterium 13_2_20CM_2_72_6]
MAAISAAVSAISPTPHEPATQGQVQIDPGRDPERVHRQVGQERHRGRGQLAPSPQPAQRLAGQRVGGYHRTELRTERGPHARGGGARDEVGDARVQRRMPAQVAQQPAPAPRRHPELPGVQPAQGPAGPGTEEVEEVVAVRGVAGGRQLADQFPGRPVVPGTHAAGDHGHSRRGRLCVSAHRSPCPGGAYYR